MSLEDKVLQALQGASSDDTPVDSEGAPLEDAFQEAWDAVKADDAKGFAEALKNALNIHKNL